MVASREVTRISPRLSLHREIIPFDEQAARPYGEIRAALEKAGTPIGSMDMLIAAHAVSLGVTLATNNTREFSRVPGLTVVDWTA